MEWECIGRRQHGDGQSAGVYAALAPQLVAYTLFVCAALVLGPLLVLTEVTYRLIEVPGIGFGKRVKSRIEGARAHWSPHVQDGSGRIRKYSE
jgi:peptidoglycan/LPS O-acetylase OafA/YrhL